MAISSILKPINGIKLYTHLFSNWISSILLIGSISLPIGAIGWSLFNTDGFIWFTAISSIIIFFLPDYFSKIILKAYATRPILTCDSPSLFSITEQIWNEAGFHNPPKLFYLPSSIVNAFIIGRKNNYYLIVSDGLLKELSTREIAGIIAHETAHIKNFDMDVIGYADISSLISWWYLLTGQLILFLNLIFLIFTDFNIPWLVPIVLIISPWINSNLQFILSEQRDMDADIEAIRLTGDPLGLASALEKRKIESSLWERILFPGIKTPEPSILRTHQDIQARIQKLYSLAEQTSDMVYPLRSIPTPLYWPSIKKKPTYHWYGLWF